MNGEITLVFTDIEGSTKLWERHGRDFQKALDLHNQMMRASIHQHDGYEVKTEGDSFMIAFGSVLNAVQFCMDAQQALHEADWPDFLSGHPAESHHDTHEQRLAGLRVRMGIHTGEPHVKPNPLTQRADYFGPAVNRAARLCDAAHGGQVLLSSKSLELAYRLLKHRHMLPGQLTDLGHYTLKGLSTPEHIWQLVPTGAAENRNTFPNLRTPSIGQTNLPHQPTEFVGRKVELQQLARCHEQGERLITLLGTGGTGKTRLAIHYGLTQVRSLTGGVWIADLTNARTTADVCSAVARALDLPLTTRDSVTQVGQAVVSRGDMLLILDNFEQVVAAASGTVAVWLSMAPNVKIIVTSRQVLWIRGEKLLAIDPLPVPPTDLDGAITKNEITPLAQNEAVSLFCLRAKQVDPTFKLNEQNTVPVVNIVRHLDGIPLAIELAASRVRMMHPKQLFERIQHRLDVLRGPVKTNTERQATLRGAIDWSWRTLEPWEQAALCQCTIFNGGFDIDAAEQLINLSAWPDAPSNIDVIQALHDKSLLFRMRVVYENPVRFDMYRSIRNFADEKFRSEAAIPGLGGQLSTGAAAFRRAQDHHAHYYAGRCEHDGGTGLDESKALAPDLQNLIRAATHASTHQIASVAARTSLAAIGILSLQGPFAATIHLTDHVLTVEELDVEARMRLLDARGTALRIVGNSKAAQAAFEQALDLAFHAQDQKFEAAVRLNLSILCRQIGRMEGARTHLEAALELALARTDHRLAARVLSNLGRHHHERGDLDLANSYFFRASDHLQRAGAPHLKAITDLNTGEIQLMKGQYASAEHTLEGALNQFQRQGDQSHAGIGNILLARLTFENGSEMASEKRFREGLALARAVGNRRFEGLALTGVARLRIRRGDLTAASEAISTALSILEEVGDPTAEGAAWAVKAEVASLANQPPLAASSIAHAEALLRDVGNQHELAQLLCVQARILLREGKRVGSERAIREASLIAEQLDLGDDAPLARAIKGVRKRLGEDVS